MAITVSSDRWQLWLLPSMVTTDVHHWQSDVQFLFAPYPYYIMYIIFILYIYYIMYIIHMSRVQIETGHPTVSGEW